MSKIIGTIVFIILAIGLAFYAGKKSVKLKYYDRVITKVDTVVVRDIVITTDSLEWMILGYQDTLKYNRRLIVKLTNRNHELHYKVDSLSKSDIYNWVQQRSK